MPEYQFLNEQRGLYDAQKYGFHCDLDGKRYSFGVFSFSVQTSSHFAFLM